MTPFNERAESMGLSVDRAEQGLFAYADAYGEVVYRNLISQISEFDPHPTDGKIVSKLAIFTKAPGWEDYQFVGYVSELYKFIGNDVLNNRIRSAINAVGIPIVEENPIPNITRTRLRTEMIIQSSQHIPNVGDVLPVMIVDNSYDGTKAATISFGIATYVNRNRVIFGFGLGELRQVHIESSSTSVSSSIASYMQVFTEDITDMITASFSTMLTEDEMLATLDVIEGLGKKRREGVSKLLQEMLPDIVEGQPVPLPSAWQVFLAIVRYSSFEPNLNVKRLMENAAESVLVIPARMYDVLDKISTL
jgi:hypothetical protein